MLSPWKQVGGIVLELALAENIRTGNVECRSLARWLFALTLTSDCSRPMINVTAT